MAFEGCPIFSDNPIFFQDKSHNSQQQPPGDCKPNCVGGSIMGICIQMQIPNTPICIICGDCNLMPHTPNSELISSHCNRARVRAAQPPAASPSALGASLADVASSVGMAWCMYMLHVYSVYYVYIYIYYIGWISRAVAVEKAAQQWTQCDYFHVSYDCGMKSKARAR